MRVLLVSVILILGSLILVACSGHDIGVLGGQGLTDEALQQIAPKMEQELLTGSSAKAYSFAASSYQERCTVGEFMGLMLMGRALIGDDIQGVEVKVAGIRHEGDKTFVDTEWWMDGRPMNVGQSQEEYPTYWIQEDGQWRWTTDDPAPCSLN